MGPRVFLYLAIITGRQAAVVGRIVWSVREGGVGEFDAPELMAGFRSADRVGEPRAGDLFLLPDGSGPWRVVDRMRDDGAGTSENVLVVELFGD
jgi:hypothetical protein